VDSSAGVTLWKRCGGGAVVVVAAADEDVDADADIGVTADGGFWREREAGIRGIIDCDEFKLSTIVVVVAPAGAFEDDGEVGRMPAVSRAVSMAFEFAEPKRLAIASAKGSTSGG
jgi:hypothetical protein